MKATILVVDDETDNLEIVSDYLAQADPEFKIIQAKNGAIGLKIAEKALPDLILTDWNMPVMDGLELTRAVKAHPGLHAVPVVMQTANTEDVQLKLAFEAGAQDYIKKPISSLELKARVQSAILLTRAQQETERLLRNILPAKVADDLKKTGKTEVTRYERVTVLFTDFKGFTAAADTMSAEELVADLHYCFSAFDRIVASHKLEKIKTIGDSYMCAGGIPVADEDHALRAVAAAKEMLAFSTTWSAEKSAAGKKGWHLRIGMHTGPVIAGVVGEHKFAYDIWGDTVNTASRMESHGEAGKINISEATFELVKHRETCEARGLVEVKGKGQLPMWWVG